VLVEGESAVSELGLRNSRKCRVCCVLSLGARKKFVSTFWEPTFKVSRLNYPWYFYFRFEVRDPHVGSRLKGFQNLRINLHPHHHLVARLQWALKRLDFTLLSSNFVARPSGTSRTAPNLTYPNLYIPNLTYPNLTSGLPQVWCRFLLDGRYYQWQRYCSHLFFQSFITWERKQVQLISKTWIW